MKKVLSRLIIFTIILLFAGNGLANSGPLMLQGKIKDVNSGLIASTIMLLLTGNGLANPDRLITSEVISAPAEDQLYHGIFPGLPIGTGEEDDITLGDQADGAEAALTDLIQLRCPKIIGFSWWDESWENDNNPDHDTNMRIQDDPALTEAFQGLVDGSDNVLGRVAE
jgi:hypothetical protein